MGRLFKRDHGEVDDRDADLTEDQHAWWAAREEVHGVPGGGETTEDPAADGTDARFSDYWTAESLFERSAVPPPGDEAANGHDPADEPLSMDLDAAHLVLQVAVGVDWEEITTAHRRLAKLYHPDRLLDLSAEAREYGRARMAEINAAHGALRELHFH